MARFIRAPRVRGSDRATGNKEIPVVDDDADLGDDGEVPATSDKAGYLRAQAQRFGQAVADRLVQLSVAIVAGLALCLSFPPFGWWYLAIAAVGSLAWVLTRETTTRAGGFGYGFLFGLAFYLPLLPWISGLVGAFPWIMLAAVQALFPGLFGLAAVSVRRLPGWPLWFAGLWAAQEWLKSTVPFGGFPWGVVGFSQTNGPLLSLAQFGGAPLLSFAVALVGFGLAAIVLEAVVWWRRGEADDTGPPAVFVPGLCISLVLLMTAVTWPHVRQAGAGADDGQAVT